jgi:hypothetical protein
MIEPHAAPSRRLSSAFRRSSALGRVLAPVMVLIVVAMPGLAGVPRVVLVEDFTSIT